MKWSRVKFSTDPGIGHTEWRRDPELVEVAGRLVSNPDFRAVFASLVASRPSKTSLPVQLTTDQLAAQAMFCSGYEFALDLMISLAKPIDTPAEEQPTFENE